MRSDFKPSKRPDKIYSKNYSNKRIKNKFDFSPYYSWEENHVKMEEKNKGNFIKSKSEIKRKKNILLYFTVKNVEEKRINNNLILKQFDGKILSKMSLIYNIRNENKIKIFGNKFLINNINNCYLLINRERNILYEYLELNKSQKNQKTLKIKLIENKPIIDMSYMFYNCIHLIYLHHLSKWDTKNIL